MDAYKHVTKINEKDNVINFEENKGGYIRKLNGRRKWKGEIM